MSERKKERSRSKDWDKIDARVHAMLGAAGIGIIIISVLFGVAYLAGWVVPVEHYVCYYTITAEDTEIVPYCVYKKDSFHLKAEIMPHLNVNSTNLKNLNFSNYSIRR